MGSNASAAFLAQDPNVCYTATTKKQRWATRGKGAGLVLPNRKHECATIPNVHIKLFTRIAQFSKGKGHRSTLYMDLSWLVIMLRLRNIKSRSEMLSAVQDIDRPLIQD